MKKFITNKIFLTIIGILLIVLVWIVLSLVFDENSLIFPGPIKTVKEMFIILGSSYVYRCLLASFIKMMIGFAFSIILAFVFGMLAGNNSSFKTIFNPFVTVIKSIPTAAIIFLMLVIVGAKNTPIIMVVLVSFPILYESFVGGFENIDKDVIDALKIDSTNNLNAIINVKLPLSIPYVIVGLTSSFALSFKIEIMAEIISGDTRAGLGSAIVSYQKNDPTNMTSILAFSLIAVIFILIVSSISKTIIRKISLWIF